MIEKDWDAINARNADLAARRLARKQKKVNNAGGKIGQMSAKLAELKAEMRITFHDAVNDRDRLCQPCQQLYGHIKNSTHKHGPHADHIIPQSEASREEKTDPRFGMGICEKQNKSRGLLKTHGAAILEEAGLFYQVLWGTDPKIPICKRRVIRPDGTPGNWFPYEKPEWMADGHRYEVSSPYLVTQF